jgi:hypothetical protein
MCRQNVVYLERYVPFYLNAVNGFGCVDNTSYYGIIFLIDNNSTITISEGLDMQAQVYVGYFEDGRFYTNDRKLVDIPENIRIHLTLFNEQDENNKIVKSSEKRPFSDLFGQWSGKIRMADDFDEPLDEMGDYM